MAPAAYRIQSEVPYDPYELSGWPVRRITRKQSEVRYQFQTRNLEMVALIPTHTSRHELRLLGQRIDISQTDEIKMMQDWLQVRGQQVPGVNAMHMHGATLMPGMLTPDEMKQLEAATGSQFDRLFLEGMIKHHGGALAMVKELLDTPGAAQESDVFAFVADVEADQRMEIDRMGAMLAMIKEQQE